MLLVAAIAERRAAFQSRTFSFLLTRRNHASHNHFKSYSFLSGCHSYRNRQRVDGGWVL